MGSLRPLADPCNKVAGRGCLRHRAEKSGRQLDIKSDLRGEGWDQAADVRQCPAWSESIRCDLPSAAPPAILDVRDLGPSTGTSFPFGLQRRPATSSRWLSRSAGSPYTR